MSSPAESRDPALPTPSSAVDEVFLTSQWSDAPPKPTAVDSPRLDEPDEPRPPVRRRVWLPIFLFLLTMASTFIAGATGWLPQAYVAFTSDPIPLRLAILKHWDDGLIYMACLLAMLLAHEMGHFLATLYYRVPASFPYFLPLPVTPIGTLGAVIRMDNRDANRKQMFDIGIAGPLAGLVVVIPLLVVGIQRLDFTQPEVLPPVQAEHLYKLGLPLGLRLLMQDMSPPGYNGETAIDITRVNPYFMAGWVGLLVTALNMMPVSQLDGGHVTYTLFGKKAHWIARAFMIITIAYMVYGGLYQLSLMIAIILLIGIDHPPTSDDTAPIGWFRYAIGIGSLVIPVLCLTLEPIKQRL